MGSLGVNTPLRWLSQVKLPGIGGVMTSGEFVVATPIPSGLAMTLSKRSSNVMSGVGELELKTNSTPWDWSEDRWQPVSTKKLQHPTTKHQRKFKHQMEKGGLNRL